MPKITPGNRLYLYQLLSRELGMRRQTLLPRAEEALEEDGLCPEDLGCEDMRSLCEQLSEFIKLTVFKKGYVYVTVVENEEYDRALAKLSDGAGEKGTTSGKPWKRKRGAKALKPVKPRHIEVVVEKEPLVEAPEEVSAPEAPEVDEKIEKYSVMRSLLAVERADVCVIMIDATEGVTEQDTKVAGEAHNAGKACIIVVNKWDLVEKDGSTMKEYTLRVREGLAYMPYAPVLFISAQTGQRVDKLFALIKEVYEQNHMRIPTGRLNSILAEATARVQPPTDKGRRLRIFYMTQASTCPPTFVCFCNDARLFHFSYQRYLENQIREVFGLTGTPVRMVIRERGDKK